ncbi:hypothetical protein ACIQ6K_16810 [Streptomyces sp. NPDC096354]|uniref:hypothetical protein n=1 Tax=Streptomyces sp. NPDC096354 TaxID=3366088 RepID=UPI0038157844
MTTSVRRKDPVLICAIAAAVDPAFPDPHLPTHEATVTLTDHRPSERRVEFVPSHA